VRISRQRPLPAACSLVPLPALGGALGAEPPSWPGVGADASEAYDGDAAEVEVLALVDAVLLVGSPARPAWRSAIGDEAAIGAGRLVDAVAAVAGKEAAVVETGHGWW
jgi:hypothetical protein